jgi:hypothetical protein
VLCDAVWVDFPPRTFLPSFPLCLLAHCRCSSVPLLSFPAGRTAVSCMLYPSCVLYQICADSDGALLLCPLEPSRRPHPCRLPSPVHHGRGCAAGFRPRGLRTILLLWRARERGRGRSSGVRTCPKQTDPGSFRRVDARVRLLTQSTDEALAARFYVLEEQARPSVPSKPDEPLGATTLHATIGGSTMELLHRTSEEGMECYHKSRRICRLADWLPRMPPCPAMKSRGSIRVEVHVAGGTVLDCGNGSVAHEMVPDDPCTKCRDARQAA